MVSSFFWVNQNVCMHTLNLSLLEEWVYRVFGGWGGGYKKTYLNLHLPTCDPNLRNEENFHWKDWAAGSWTLFQRSPPFHLVYVCIMYIILLYNQNVALKSCKHFNVSLVKRNGYNVRARARSFIHSSMTVGQELTKRQCVLKSLIKDRQYSKLRNCLSLVTAAIYYMDCLDPYH